MSKKTKKDLSRIDAFQRFFLQLANWGQRNVKQITIAIAPLLLVLIAVVIGRTYLQSQKDKRIAAIAEINRSYDEEQEKAGTQRAELQKKIKKIRELDEKSEKKKKEGDKSAALAKLETQLREIKADHRGSFAQYRDFFQQQQRSPEGWVAAMAAIGIAIGNKQHAAARELLTELLQHSHKSTFYQVQARLLYVKLLEEEGNLEKALAEIEHAYRLAPAEFKPEALLIKIRLLLAQQQTDSAREVCEELIKTFADSRAASKARAIKVLLN